jgi:hypothetical protein
MFCERHCGRLANPMRGSCHYRHFPGKHTGYPSSIAVV